ncbi:MAG: hypothetical protein E7068_02655 [Lentimicrobiaceae bacterium]|nr:hypothetical protein [Lentimicrobiaceae bacterium]
MNNDAGKISFESGLDLTGLDRDIKAAQDRFRELNGNVQKECSGIDGSIRNIGASIAAVFTVQKAGEFIKKMVAVRGEIESLEKSFGILAGTVQGKKLFEDIKDFAVKTPMTMPMPALAKGAQTLLAFNYEAENVMPILRAIGDISMGNEQKFNSLVLAFSQMSSTGKLMGQDLLQMINAGFNPLAVISEQTGKSIGVLKEEMAAGAISADMITKAFMDATSEGGKFNGMLEQQSKGIEGSLSNLEGAIQDMFNELGEKSQGVITSSIQNVTALVQNYEKVGRVIAELIGAYGLYKAALMGITAINNTATAAAHTQEAASLYQLLTAEQQASISKKGLSTASAEYYNLVKAETTANIEAAQIALVKAREEVTAASVTMKAKRGEYASAKQLEAQRIKELAEIKVTGNAKQIEAAQRKLNKAATDRETAGIAYQSATRDFHTKRTAVETAAKNANTLASNANTAAKSANATATNFLAVAKTKLTAVTKKLTAAVMKNPYAIAAAAVIALGFAIYKLATHQSEAEKAQSRLNKAFKEADKNIISERTQIDYLFGRLKAAKEGTEEYEAAKKQIINQYGSYLSGLSDEIQSLKDVEGAYKAITEAAKESAMARASEAYIKEEADNYASQISDIRDEVKKMMEEKFGTEKGYEYFWKIVPVLEGGDMTDEIRDIISQFDETEYIMSGSSSGMGVEAKEITTNDLKSQLTNAAKVRKVLNNAIEKANVMFGTTPQESKKEDEGNSEDTVKVPIYGVDYEEARKEWETAKKELQAIEKDKDNFTTKQYEDAKSSEETAKKRFSELGGDVSDKKDSATTKAESTLEKELKDASKARQELEKELYFQEQQNRINFETNERKRKEIQMKLDHEKELYNLEQQKQSAIDAEIERQRAIFNARENDKAANDKNYTKKTFSEADIDTTQIDDINSSYSKLFEQLREMQDEELSELQAEESKAMNEYLAQYGNYLEKRSAITALYKEKIDNAGTEGERKSLTAQMTEELSELDIEANKTTASISRLFGDMSNKTVADMRAIADEAERALAFLISGEWDSAQGLEFGITQETFDILSKSPEELEKIRKGINDIRREADHSEVGFKKMANGLKQIFNAGNDVGKTKKALAEIESGLNDVMQVGSFLSDTFTSLGDAFGNDTLKGIGEGISTAMDVAGSTMQGMQAGAMFGPVGAAIGGAIGLVSSLATSIAKLHDKKKQAEIDETIDKYEDLNSSVDNYGKIAEDSFGSGKKAAIEQQMALKQLQIELLKTAIAQEEQKKDPDDGKIQEWENQITGLESEVDDLGDAAVDAIFGESISTAIENFTSAITDAWANTGNASQKAKDVVKNMLKQMISESIKAMIQSSGALEEIRTKMEEFFLDGIISASEQAILEGMAENLANEIENKYGWADDLFADSEFSQDSTKKGFQAMSQDSADELNGRFTAMQIDTSNIKSLCDSIHVNTQHLINGLVAVKEHTDEIKNIALSSLDYLETISRNTHELYEMNERLGKIEQNTRNL